MKKDNRGFLTGVENTLVVPDTTAQESCLKLYSLGIVVKDKVEGSDIIRVTPIEHLSYSKGRLVDINIPNKSNSPNLMGVGKTSAVDGKVYVEATWLPWGNNGNRSSAPDVVEAETVLLLKYSDDERLYWTTIFREPDLRRLETVLYTYGAIKKKGVRLDKTNTYWLEIDTRRGKCQFHTSTANNEPYSYDIKIDTKNGEVFIVDNINNKIVLDSAHSTARVETNNEILLKTRRLVFDVDEIVGM